MNNPCETNPDYWDCECETDYIHSKKETICYYCGAHQEDMPDSRVNEIARDKYLKYLDRLRESGETNMFGGAIYLQADFPELSENEAKDILMYWMDSFVKRER